MCVSSQSLSASTVSKRQTRSAPRPSEDRAPTCTEAGSCERGIFPPPPSPARCSLLTFTSLSSCDSPCDSCPVLPGRGRGPMTGSSADCSLWCITMLAACWIMLGEAPCFCSCCWNRKSLVGPLVWNAATKADSQGFVSSRGEVENTQHQTTKVVLANLNRQSLLRTCSLFN